MPIPNIQFDDVNNFNRPAGGWHPKIAKQNKSAGYVIREMSFHVQNGWHCESDTEIMSDSVALGWVTGHFNGDLDVISKQAARFLGTTKLQQLSERAQRDGDWWSATLYSHSLALVMFEEFADPGLKICRETLALSEKVDCKGDAAFQSAKDYLEVLALGRLLSGYDPSDLPAYKPRMMKLSDSDAMLYDPVTTYGFLGQLFVVAHTMTSNMLGLTEGMMSLTNKIMAMAETMESGSENRRRALLAELGWPSMFFDHLTRHPDFDPWKFYG